MGSPTVTGVPLISVMVSVSPSGSLSLTSRFRVTGVSSGTVTRSLTASGASLTGVTSTCTLACTGVRPSVTV